MTQPTNPSAPTGWKLVPLEPTDAMLDAAARTEELHLEWGEDPYVKNTHEVWAAMCAAAPSIDSSMAAAKGEAP